MSGSHVLETFEELTSEIKELRQRRASLDVEIAAIRARTTTLEKEVFRLFDGHLLNPGRSGAVRRELGLVVAETAEWRCQRCDKPIARLRGRGSGLRGDLQRSDGMIDHIVPRRLGGPDHAWNLALLCMRCNLSKGGRLDTDLLRIALLRLGSP